MSAIHKDWRYAVEDAQFYEEHGYRIYEHFLSTAGLSQGQQEIDRMLAQLQTGRDPADIISPHQIHRWIWNLATEPKILDMIEAQIGPDIVLWSSHLLCKPPVTGIAIPWHQDAPYWNVGGPLPAGLWIAFDAMAEDNGAMSVLPGWHKKGTLPIDPREDGLFDQMISPHIIPENVNNLKVQYRMPAGGMAIHHAMIPHNSIPNQSNRWRRVLVFRYMSAGGTMGAKTYEDYRDGSPMPREFLLVRGKDVANRGLPQVPLAFA